MAPTPEKKRLALIVGSGLSVEAKLPTTADLAKAFLDCPGTQASRGWLGEAAENRVSAILRGFWVDAFGYTDKNPSLEDHFTLLDLAANSGHHLGPRYNPKKLRAIRRFSIHRIFQHLDVKYERSELIERVFQRLRNDFRLSMASLNWDIVSEAHLNWRIHYGIHVDWLEEPPEGAEKNTCVLKMHGSSNWVYCDSCRRIHAGLQKEALFRRAFINVDDFKLFGKAAKLPENRELTLNCRHCGNQVGGRLATFSFRKAFSIDQFQAIWNRAHHELSSADSWLFIGYSLPDADFEFKHLLKSAQLARKADKPLKIEAVIGSKQETEDRFRCFFGTAIKHVQKGGLKAWTDQRMQTFCEEAGR